MQVRRYELGRNSKAYDAEFDCGICGLQKPFIVNVEIGYSYEFLCFDCIETMHDLVVKEKV